MGQNCSTSCKQVEVENPELSRHESPDPVMYDLMRKSIQATTPPPPTTNSGKANKRRPHGQHHLLFKHSPKSSVDSLQYLHPHHSSIDSGVGSGLTGMVSSTTSPITSNWTPTEFPTMGCPTRLLIRRRSLRVIEEGGGTHIYAIRYPEDTKDAIVAEQSALPVPASRQEQCPPKRSHSSSVQTNPNNKESLPLPVLEGGDIFTTAAMASIPRQSVVDWVTVSEEHNIYIADVGITAAQCDHIVSMTEQACRGQYAAYTYAKQTLGCREYPALAQTSFMPVHTVVHAITQKFSSSRILQLDDREPHIVKYDVTRKERQKLDMHTDKSEWTFLIALSNGCGVDYEGGGTYFECLDATVHIQRGHALIFPGKLRHCGQKITSGLRFLLVGFLVDKTSSSTTNGSSSSSSTVGSTSTPSPQVAGVSSSSSLLQSTPASLPLSVPSPPPSPTSSPPSSPPSLSGAVPTRS